MPLVPLSTAADPRYNEYRQLTDAKARRSIEADHGSFIAEGLIVLQTVVDAGRNIRSVLCAESKVDRLREVVDVNAVLVHVVDDASMRDITGFDVHRGVLASVDRWPLPSVSEVCGQAEHLLLVEGVNDHENVGALFRNAAAFGAHVIIDDLVADPLYRRSVRVSAGHVVRMPWTSGSIADVCGSLIADSWTVAALSPTGAETVAHVAASSSRVAWLVGAEGPGLTERAMRAASVIARIPMANDVDSVNVATAAAIALSHTSA